MNAFVAFVARVVGVGTIVVVVGTVVVVVVLVVLAVVVERGTGPGVDAFGGEEELQALSTTTTTATYDARAVNTGPYATERMRSRPPVRPSVLGLVVTIVAIAVAAAFGGGGGSPHGSGANAPTSTTAVHSESSTTTKPTVAPTTEPAKAATTTRAPATVVATTRPTSPPTDPTTSPPTSARSSLLVDRLNGVDGAGQVIAVAASGYGATTATFTAYQRTATGWQQVFGPWLAHLGRNGFAPPGSKHEGDGRTPSGSYGFSFFFGVRTNPGVKFAYRVVDGRWTVWDDDSSSANYNEWIDNRTQSAGASPEPMYVPGVYDYGAVIAYNTARSPGLGSAIFMHVSSGGTTAGCVALPESQLLSVLRWLDPGRTPRIVMGTLAAITS